MLVLTRREGEKIIIGGSIEIVVSEIQGDKVRVGISAPQNLEILRGELLEAARSANQEAASGDIDIAALARPGEEPLKLGRQTPQI